MVVVVVVVVVQGGNVQGIALVQFVMLNKTMFYDDLCQDLGPRPGRSEKQYS